MLAPDRAFALALDPSLILTARGITPDPWQRSFLLSPAASPSSTAPARPASPPFPDDLYRAVRPMLAVSHPERVRRGRVSPDAIGRGD